MNYILYLYVEKICCKNKTKFQMYFKTVFLPSVGRPGSRPDDRPMCTSGHCAFRLTSLSTDCKPNSSLFCSVDQHYPQSKIWPFAVDRRACFGTICP